jgi:hypothetical protein
LIDTLTDEFAVMMNSDAPFSDKMASMMDMKLALSRKLSMDLLSDLFAASSEEVLYHYRNKVDRNLDLARSLFVQAHENSDIRRELDIEIVMAMFNYQMELCSKPEFRALFKDVESMSKQMMELILYGIVGNRV